MSEHKRRWFPSPGWLMIAAVLVVELWVFLSVWLPYQREQVAIREIERLGGTVSVDWAGPQWLITGPEWLQEIVADGWLSWFDRAFYVDLDGTMVSDEELKILSNLTRVESLTLNNTQISNDGLQHLSGSSNLTRVSLLKTQVSNDGLKHLRGLTRLDKLWLHMSQVTDEGVKELQKALPDCHIEY